MRRVASPPHTSGAARRRRRRRRTHETTKILHPAAHFARTPAPFHGRPACACIRYYIIFTILLHVHEYNITIITTTSTATLSIWNLLSIWKVSKPSPPLILHLNGARTFRSMKYTTDRVWHPRIIAVFDRNYFENLDFFEKLPDIRV